MQAKNLLSNYTVQQLERYLELNRMKKSGTKAELVSRAADAIANGCLRRCPVCKQGFLVASTTSGATKRSVFCPGGFDPVAREKKHCDFEADNYEREPWRWA